MQTSQQHPVVPTKQAAALLGVHPDTLRDWYRAGCPYRKLNRRDRAVVIDEVQAWLASRASEPPPRRARAEAAAEVSP